jgi:prevent-host-death family protein
MAALIRPISITELKQRCHEVVRKVEQTGKPVTITRRGRVVAQLEPARSKPWERLRGRAKWLAPAGETFIKERDLKGF